MVSPIVLYCHHPRQIDAATRHQLASTLPLDSQNKIRQYQRWQDAQNALIGRLLLKECLWRVQSHASLSLASLKYSAFGRPYLADGPDFNISHTENLVACALSPSTHVGVDIEQINPLNLEDFTVFMTEAERAEIFSATNPTRTFYQWWTKKEALVKADGQGLSHPIKKVVIKNNQGHVPSGNRFQLHPLNLPNSFIGHLATNNMACPQVEDISFNTLLQRNQEYQSNLIPLA